MSGFDGFMAGFLGQTSKNIGERKDEAHKYFTEKMELAFETAHTLRTQNKPKMDAALQTANQMKAAGVPNDIVMAIANQNPDDLDTFYKTVQDMQLKGVKFNEQTYRDLLKVDGEFNPGNENVTSLLTKIYQPLTANAVADPESFEFDSKGTIWATMMGYNAMERANKKLETTEVLPGMSAADVLAYSGGANTGVMGNNSVTLNAEKAGDLIRNSKEEDAPSATETRAVLTTFDEIAAEERKNPDLLDNPDREIIVKQRAAERLRKLMPGMAARPEFADIFGVAPPAETPPPPSAPESPATAPVAPLASGVAAEANTAPQSLPDGSTLEKVLPDGTLGYVSPTGQKRRYTKAYVDMITKGQQEMDKTAPSPDAWFNPLGG
jgi:hypothetical protein